MIFAFYFKVYAFLSSYVYEYLPACVYVHYMHAYYLWRPKEGITFPRTGVTVDCQLPGRLL